MHYRISAIAGLMLLGSSAYALAQSPAPAPSAASAMQPGTSMSGVTFKLDAQNKSGETGTANLAQVGEDIKVTVVTTGGGTDPQPIHIHDGTCAKLDPKPKYPLTTVQDGKSTTVIKGMKLSTLENGMYAINVHKSTSEVATYVSCGDIPKVAAK